MFVYKYPRPSLTVDAVVFLNDRNETKVLLIKRGNPPFQDSWAFPGGFVDMEETLEQSVVRELEEETKLKDISLRQLKAYSSIDRDPRGRTVSVAFVGITDSTNCKVKGADDASEARWFSLNEIPELAFDHKAILEDAVNFCDFVNIK